MIDMEHFLLLSIQKWMIKLPYTPSQKMNDQTTNKKSNCVSQKKNYHILRNIDEIIS